MGPNPAAVNVATINFHFAHNYGAVLQALALQDRLRSLGCEVMTIDYRPLGHGQQYAVCPRPFLSAVWKFRGARSLGGSRLSALRQAVRRGARAVLTWGDRRARRAQHERFESYLSKYFQFTRTYRDIRDLREDAPLADLYVAGSDQLWNPTNTGGLDPAYFLDFGRPHVVRAGYAISAVQLDVRRYRTVLKRIGSRLDYVSLREGSLASVLGETLGVEAHVVADPVVLMTAEAWGNYMTSKVQPARPYLLVYAVRTHATYRTLAETVARLRAELGSDVIDISLEQADWPFPVTRRQDVDPGDFMALIAGADFVVSNSFHATAFALLFHRQFAVVSEPGTGERMIELLTQVGLENRIVDDGELDLLTNQIDYDAVDINLQRLREKGMDYLRAVVSEARCRMVRLQV